MQTADGKKKCPRCGDVKPAEGNFYKVKSRLETADPYAGYCIACTKKAAVRWQKKSSVRESERMKRARLLNTGPALNERRRSRKVSDRRAVLVAALKDRPCSDCVVKYPRPVMEFDHRDPSTKDRRFGGPGGMAARTSVAVFLAEVEKCDVVCANCHRMRTWARLQAAKTPERRKEQEATTIEHGA